jgi:DNA modification methylase
MENKMTTIKIEQGNCLEVLKEMPEQSVNTCVTSPPYWGLRDYGESDQLGLEDTPEEYVANMVQLFREVRRVLRDDGTVWLNLGDSYVGGGRGWQWSKEGTIQQAHIDAGVKYGSPTGKIDGLKPKDLVGIPWRVAFALQADGWYLRQDIIWHKPNPMPESVTDRCTKAHEYIFLLSKNKKYYYDNDAIKEPAKDWGTRDRSKGKYHNKGTGLTPHTGLEKSYPTKNKRSVWTVTTKPFRGAHFAVFPMDLIEPCVLAGCPENGTVLDPFGGSGTTGLVAKQNKRNAVLIELNAKYIDIAEDRIASTFMQSCLDI